MIMNTKAATLSLAAVIGYNLQIVPEFPLPALLITISQLDVVMVTRFRPKLN
jgi:hypothetical protein